MPWELTGNAATNPATNFLGTTDGQPLVIRTNGVEQVRVETNGRLSVANGGAVINGVSVGVDVPGINYPFEYETVGVTSTNFNLRLQSPNSIIFHTGNPPTEKIIVTSDGDLQLVGADCAEELAVASLNEIDAGTVLVIGEGGRLEPCTEKYDTRVAGVVSGANGLKPGVVLGKSAGGTSLPVALIGTVFCKVDATETAVEVGDLLTTSAHEGHAMKANHRGMAAGAVLGKALSALPSGLGMIPILVALQ
jgi:hypothetical protein